MDRVHDKAISLQESLRTLSLQPDKEEIIFKAHNVLIGKVLSTRSFRRFTITEIIGKFWSFTNSVQIEKLEENIFKFTFRNKGELEYVFSNRPWCLNGAHLILKEWPDDKSLNEISFETSTFFIQVHGLPPIFLHEGTARLIGNKVGFIHQSSINKRCVVANRYLRFLVEISVNNPLPAGFFLDRANENDIWIQFKLERLLDFCYMCGLLDHVTGRCKFRDSMMVTTPNGIAAKLFGPWLRSEHRGSLLFINVPEKETLQDLESGEIVPSGELTLISRQGQLETGGKSDSNEYSRQRTIVEYCNVKAQCPELDSLDSTLKKQDLGNSDTLQAIVMERFRDLNWDVNQHADWAKGVLKEFVSIKDAERRALDGLDPDWLGIIGLGGITFCRLPNPKNPFVPLLGPNMKREAMTNEDPRPKRAALTSTMNIPEKC